MADLDSILSGQGAVASESSENVEKETQAVVEQAQAEQGTDDQQQTGAEGDGGQKMVPHEALHAEKQKVKRYTEQVASFEKTLADRDAAWERRFSQLIDKLGPQQPAAEEPKVLEPWDEGYTDSIRKPFEQTVQTQREQFSQIMAVEKHGAEVVQAAYKALDEHPNAGAILAGIRKSIHPYGALVEWHKREQARAEIGNDPEAYKAKLRDELKAEILAEIQAGAGQQQTQTGQGTATVMPTDLAGVRNVGNRSGPAWGGPQSLNDIFDRSRKPTAA